MSSPQAPRVQINAGFWQERRRVNAVQAIFHQWEQLEASGCIDNFRIAAGEKEGFREGWFFADSDAYKWLEAAARISASQPDRQLSEIMDGFIGLLERAQTPDGYLFTYNQIHFPQVRWSNLQIEHELYCHGHLIEAGVSHFETGGEKRLLAIARKAADRIVTDFRGKGPLHTPGHEEIEIALLRLYQLTQAEAYLEIATQFLEQRGRARFFGLAVLRQNGSVQRRASQVAERRQEYLRTHPEHTAFELPPNNQAVKPRFTDLRWKLNALNGKYFQQHAPLRAQTTPVGHAVRFAYLQTAAAMLSRLSSERSLLPALEQAWERMVVRRMYLTGGIGSLPGLEGFGRDFELDPESAYAETCAALGCMFWNWEMSRLTGQARYSDLFERQLYNAAAVGMGLDGRSYLYNNPLLCRGGVQRQPWFAIPCCPSNLSRTWADLPNRIYLPHAGTIDVLQYISSRAVLGLDESTLTIEQRSGLPWNGKVTLQIECAAPTEFALRLRRPSWSAAMVLAVNGQPQSLPEIPAAPGEATACGYDPRRSDWIILERTWSAGDRIEIEFGMEAQARPASPELIRKNPGAYRDKLAVTRGPLVYCLESIDQPGLDLFSLRLNPHSLQAADAPDLLGGITTIQAQTRQGQPLIFIPYYLWANRGPTQMTVYVNH